MTDTPEVVWGSPPLVRPGERCPACGRTQFADHPVLAITTTADVTAEMIQTTDDLAYEDDQGRIDWERTLDDIDGGYHPDACWLFPPQSDDPVFEKIKRGVRALRREEG